MRLWSVMVSQAPRPVRSACGTATGATTSSFQLFQIGDELPDLLVGQRDLGHGDVRLDRLRILEPAVQVLEVLGSV